MNPILVHGALLLVSIIYAATYSIAKLVMPEFLSPSAFILIRVSVAGLLFSLFHRAFFHYSKVDRSDLWPLAVSGFFGVAANMLLFFEGLSRSTPINASVLMLFSPLFVLLFNRWMHQTKISYRQSGGMLIAAIGAILLIGGTSFRVSKEHVLGDILVVLNAVSFSYYLVYSAKLLQKYPSITVIRYVFIFGWLFVLPFGLFDLGAAEPAQWNNTIWASVIFTAVGTTFIAYLLNAWALQKAGSVVVGSYIYLQPLLAGIIAIAMGKDSLSAEKVIFALMIFTGVYLVNRK